MKLIVAVFAALVALTVSAEESNHGKVPPCEEERRQLGEITVGKFIPQCTAFGFYQAKQCHGSTGHCWCVFPDSGKEIDNTRVAPGHGDPPCTACHVQRALGLRPHGFVGGYVPTCDPDGMFTASQTHPSTGHSWCVDRFTGEPIDGTESERGKSPLVDCAALSIWASRMYLQFMEKTGPCEAKRLAMNGLIGVHKPSCTSTGFYKAEQIHGSSGYRWCVHPETGKEIEDSRKGPSEGPLKCGACHKKLEQMLGTTLIGQDFPLCDDKGHFKPVQCSHDGFCWCIDLVNGNIIGEKRKLGDKLDCVN